MIHKDQISPKKNKFDLLNLFKPKVLGINLIGLMIASSLGSFVIAVIIKTTVNLNNNLQLINAITELEQSVRIIYKIFNKIFYANGFGSLNNFNTFYINSTNTNLNFSMWYANGSDGLASAINNNFISCSGRTLDSNINPQEIAVFMRKFAFDSSTSGYLTCMNRLSGLTSSDRTADPTSFMPLVKQNQIVGFYATVLVEDPLNEGKLRFLPITYANAAPSGAPVTYNSFGINLALILRSSVPVYNVAKKTSFDKILNIDSPDFAFTRTDQYLYKLVVISSPFINRKNNDINNSIKTRLIKN